MKTWSVTFWLATGPIKGSRVSIEVEVNEDRTELHAISQAFRKFEGAGVTPMLLDFISVEEVEAA
jgi:hypothetical protein